ncbi:MAG: helix-turn-helix transcriptional regulator [Clostridia bacterium]|nr:helix-turn-helix transcriptional regulator [Clostridia bacterium]
MPHTDIGEKIKKLRVQRNMTQSDLAGDQITRNMLSRVENGAALPSLPTVWYLAERLGVPAGFLLAEGDDDRVWRKMNRIDGIRRVLRSGDARICLELCREDAEVSEADDEIYLIMAQCSLSIAQEEFHLGRLHQSCAALDSAVEYAERTVYDTTAIRQTAALYFRFMRGLSAMLYSETIADVDDPLIGCHDAFGRYVLAREALEAGEERRVAAYLKQQDENDLWQLHFSAHAAMVRGEYEKAEQTLRRLLHAEAARSEVLLYCVFCDLEICCREQSDFRGAYEYSQNKVALLERMLREA